MEKEEHINDELSVIESIDLYRRNMREKFIEDTKKESIKSVTHCPTCGGECSIVLNEDKSHSYKSKHGIN